MNQLMESKQIKEIHVDKMQFRVISKHPQYSSDTAAKMKRICAGSFTRYLKSIRKSIQYSLSHVPCS